METCWSCNINKDKSEFYARQKRCKSCTIKASAVWAKANPDKVRWYQRKYIESHRERVNAWHREYNKRNPRKKYKKTEYQKCLVAEWKKINKQATRAHCRLQYAIRKGKIERPGTCSSCGKAGKIDGHHKDYSKPLEVTWVCPSCHRMIHEGHLAIRDFSIDSPSKQD